MSLKKFPNYSPASSEEELFIKNIDPKKMPSHIAIIMDGNGRWAKQHGFVSRIIGHRNGTKSVRRIVTACAELGIKALSLYAFSMENWNRPKSEVYKLMELLNDYLINERSTLMQNNVSLIASGRLEMLPDKIGKTLFETIELSKNNSGLKLNLALSYGGRAEIIDAVKKIADSAVNKRIDPAHIDEETFSKYLYHPELPEPDLLIRTSGELRVSNFLLWQIAYAEIYITPVLWPDFSTLDLLKAIEDYQKRDRRFGKVKTSEGAN